MMDETENVLQSAIHALIKSGRHVSKDDWLPLYKVDDGTELTERQLIAVAQEITQR